MSKAKKQETPNPPRFAIMNTCDAPQRRMVCEWIPKVGYCYMRRSVEPHLKDFDGMMPSRPTAIESFGFVSDVCGTEVVFRRVGPSTATYEDGTPRYWQDVNWDKVFTLPIVGRVTRKRK